MDGQLYRIECFELSGLIKDFIKFVAEYRQLPSSFNANQAAIITSDLLELQRAAEIGRMVEAWKEDPNHKVILKTLLPNGGEILHPLSSALEKFREEQEGGK